MKTVGLLYHSERSEESRAASARDGRFLAALGMTWPAVRSSSRLFTFSRLRVLFVALAISLAGAASAAEPVPSFRNDVMPVLSKAGCNAGACHGNKSGKGGFKLSLRGQDPGDDYVTLTRDLFARRVDPIDPGRSLMLLKPTAQLAHEGGKRFGEDSPEYDVLRRWIAAGAPRDAEGAPTLVRLDVSPSQQVLVEPSNRMKITATAVFSDGSSRDVSRWAVYEQSVDLAKVSPDGLAERGEMVADRPGETTVIVRFLHLQQPVRLAFVPARPEFSWSGPAARNDVDEHVFAKLRTLRTNPSGPCTDGEFARRAYLDLLGALPTAEEAKAFVADTSPDKRERLVETLLNRPEYADFWALKWADLLRIEERTLDRKGVAAFHRWVRQGVAENVPLDRFVRDMVSARGSTYANPPANYYRALRDPVTRGEATAQVFLGVRLQCAQCHNHPFDRWTQDDYYGWADVFGRVEYKVLENRRRDTNDGHEFVGEQVVYEATDGGANDPRPGRRATARLLGEAGSVRIDDGSSRLDVLGGWLTGPGNGLFAKAQVNRIWYHLMGRGLVDPVDDFRATNPASHPELLDALAADFVARGYDVRHVIKLIMASQTYALSSEPNASNRGDEVNYSHVLPRRLTAEQLLDAQHAVAGVPAEFGGYPAGTRAVQLAGVQAGRARRQAMPMSEQFLVTFGKPPRQLSCDCERSTDTTLGQTFHLISGPGVTRLVGHSDNRISTLLAASNADAEVVEELYWSALTRRPTPEEADAMLSHVRASKDRRKGYEDVLWALFNAKEFVLRK